MQTALQTITKIIYAVGCDEFPSIAARALCDFASFELATIVVHRRNTKPSLLFDNFACTGSRQGLRNYLSITHRLNPVLKRPGTLGAVRASDYTVTPALNPQTLPYFRKASEEELGFLTIGWPAGLEELGLYFEACNGRVEFCVYRQRACSPASDKTLHQLNALCGPISAAFGCHHFLTRASAPAAGLSPRETQVVELMLLGYGTEAIALRLQLSRYTVKDYRKQIFRKLGISSLAELFALSLRSLQISPLRGGVPL